MRISRSIHAWVLVALLLAIGCSPARSGGVRGMRPDGSVIFDDDAHVSGCEPTPDSDGDGIADDREGMSDLDGDGTPNHLDDDSDGDGLLDSVEARSSNPCAPADSDGDGTPDFADRDSDNDGISDADEVTDGTDPVSIDTDGDGISDLAERAAGTDPRDRMSTIPSTDFFVVLPYNGDRAMRPLRFGTNISQADVFFLVDMTGSMQGERTNLIRGLLDTIIPGVQGAIRDVQFGAGGFDDYPVDSYGWPRGNPFGSGGGDLPFYLLREIGPGNADLGRWSIAAGPTMCPSSPSTDDIGMITGAANGTPDILEAVQGLPCHFGNDGPESYVPALHATATGMGLTWPGGMVPPRACPAIPDEPATRRGYPCFRSGSLPIVLLFGDNLFHNGPGGSNPYSFAAPTFDATATALNGVGARVMGIYSGGAFGGARADYEAIARATGAVRADGTPLVFDIAADGSGLSAAVVDAVAQLVGGTPQDVSTTTENVDGNPDGFDARRFIKSIVPLEGYGPDGLPGARPGISYRSRDMTTFYEVIPGTQVEFTVDFWNDVRPPADVAQVFRARIIVVGNGVARLDERQVYIIVPPEGGTILI